MKDPLFMAHIPDNKIRGYCVCATMANIKGVEDDKDNLFRELPFWLRIGPISWNFSDKDIGQWLAF